MSYYFNPHGHQCPWYPYSELLGYPSASRCEEVACYILSEPINATTSLALVLAAVLCSKFRFKKDHPDIKLFSNIFLLSGVFLAVFHTMNNFATQIIAHGSLFFLLMIGLTKNLIRMGKINYNGRTPTLLSSLFIFLLLNFILYKQHAYPEALLPLTFILVIITNMLASRDETKISSQNLYISFIFFMTACVVIYLDQINYNCLPNSYLQLHSLGHILLAISMGLFYKHLYQFYPLKVNKTPIIDQDEHILDETDAIIGSENFDDESDFEFDEQLDDENDDTQIEFDFENLGPNSTEVDNENMEDSSEPQDGDDSEDDKKS